MTFTREPLQVVEIIQPLCSRTFGTSPCLATGSKCFNTDETCKFVTALDLTQSVVMRFVAPFSHRAPVEGADMLLDETGASLLDETNAALEAEGDATVFNAALAIPALMSVSTSPTVLNVGAGNEDIQPLGLRAVAEVLIKDFPSNDVGFDPYLADRSYDPLTRGSFWTKWLARNPYHVGMTLRVYDGYVGDSLAQMIKREYSIEKIDATRSQVRITAKDILRKVTDTKITAPFLSPGALSLSLNNTATTFQVAGALVTDYPEAGFLRINGEVMAYTGRAVVSGNIEFSGVTRGQLGTTAAAHNQFDRVQRVLAYVNTPVSDIIYDLLTVWGGVPASYIEKADWDAEQSEWRELYAFTAYLTDPVEIQKLLGELCQQAMVNIWWDERIQRIIYRAQRPNFAPNTLTQEGHIVADSFVVEERPERRASQVYVYYGLRNPTLSLSDKTSFANAEAFLDIDKERQYGEPAIREIFCRWVNTAVIAQTLASAYLTRFRDVRRYVSFNLTAKDIATCWTGDIMLIKHFLRVDPTGAELIEPWLVTSAETLDQGHLYRFQAEDNESGGLLWEWVADGNSEPNADTGAWVDENGADDAGNQLAFGWI